MRGKHFFILFLLILLFCIAAYPILIDRVAIPNRVIDRSYQQFLLKASKPIKNKIIVSGGSSSIHSIDTRLMEEHFKRHVIVLADNAGYPLEHRIYNLSNYVSAGDLIIFSLEWTYFTESGRPPNNYVNGVLDKTGSLSFYYNELPYYKKLDFIYRHIPFTLALERILTRNSSWRVNDKLLQNENDSIYYIHGSLNYGSRGTQLSNNPKDFTGVPQNTRTCDEYLFAINKRGGNFKVSEQFKDNLALLQKMTRETGAEVIFTWPTVVGKTGNECYTSKEVKDNINRHTQEIIAEVNRHGFKFIGNIEDSKFDNSCFLNTYYHIKADCSVERTKRLIDLLETNGVTTATGYSTQESEKILNDYLARIELPLLEKFKPLPINVPIKLNYLTRNLIASSGWSYRGKNGAWSNGNTSTILIPMIDTTVNYIKFKGNYFAPEPDEKTGVWINGDFIGKFILTNQTIYVADSLNNDSYNRIVFEHSNPVSPFDLGLDSKDRRKLKYIIHSIELLTDIISPPVNVPIEINLQNTDILLSNGWSYREKKGVWSTGKSSTIIFPKLDTTVNAIRLKGYYFKREPDEKTGVWINGNFIGDYLLFDQVIYVDGSLDNDSYNKIVLEHSNLASPFELGLNTDTRELKYKLQSIEFLN